MERISCDDLFLNICSMVSHRSPDKHTKLGAVIATNDNRIVSTGYNGWVRGVNPIDENDPRWESPRKYTWMAHAERNAMDNALCAGVPISGCKIYSLIKPCADCTRGIIQTGIREFHYDVEANDRYLSLATDANTWVAASKDVDQMFCEAGIKMVGHILKNRMVPLLLRGQELPIEISNPIIPRMPIVQPTPFSPQYTPEVPFYRPTVFCKSELNCGVPADDDD